MTPTLTATAAWPWMLHEDENDQPPEEPVKITLQQVYKNLHQEDSNSHRRPLVKDLIQEHQDPIKAIRSSLENHPLYESSKHDDLWALRFWLTHKDQHMTTKRAIVAATRAARHTLQFRKELGLDQWDIRNYSPSDCAEGTMVQDFLQHWDSDACVFVPPVSCAGGGQGSSSSSGPTCFFQLQNAQQTSNSKGELSEDYWFAMMGHCAEWSFQWADYVTRKTGRLTMATCTFDATGLCTSSVGSDSYRKGHKTFGILEEFYPQTLEAINVCNAPLVLRTLWKVWGPTTQSTPVDIVQTHIHDVLDWVLQKPLGEGSLSTLLTEMSEQW